MFNSENSFCIRAFQRGDPGAFSFIFSYYYPSLCFFASRLMSGMPVYEDITQESFIRLWQKHDAFSCQDSIKAFLYIITRNACLNFIKLCRRQQKYRERWAVHWTETEDCVLRRILQADVSNEVQAAVKKLPPECGRIMWLGYIEGFANRQIAQQLHLSVSTVKNQKTRGLSLLKKRMMPVN